jgi:hypothetical protein
MVRKEFFFSVDFHLISSSSSLFLFVVDGRQGREGIMNCIDEARAVVGFYVRKVSTRAIMRIADDGKLLPPKVSILFPTLFLFIPINRFNRRLSLILNHYPVCYCV